MLRGGRRYKKAGVCLLDLVLPTCLFGSTMIGDDKLMRTSFVRAGYSPKTPQQHLGPRLRGPKCLIKLASPRGFEPRSLP